MNWGQELELALSYSAFNNETVIVNWFDAEGNGAKAIWAGRARHIFSKMQEKPEYSYTNPLSLVIGWTDTNNMIIRCVVTKNSTIDKWEDIYLAIKDCLTLAELRDLIARVNLPQPTLNLIYELSREVVARNRREHGID
jgi:hypothetical protein